MLGEGTLEPFGREDDPTAKVRETGVQEGSQVSGSELGGGR